MSVLRTLRPRQRIGEGSIMYDTHQGRPSGRPWCCICGLIPLAEIFREDDVDFNADSLVDIDFIASALLYAIF